MHLIFAQIIFYGSLFLLFLLLLHRRRALRAGRVLRFLLLTAITFTFVWMRWVEPYQIAIRKTTIDLGLGKRIAVIGDLHLGVYKDRTYLQRVVNTINTQPSVDMVFIAGDVSYWPSSDLSTLKELFQPVADLHVPVYMVLGNHDLEKPGPKRKKELVQALESVGVTFLENDVIDFGKRTLVGLGDHDDGGDNVLLLNQFHVTETVVVLTHNPDTIRQYKNYNADLTIVGHTHCGQIRLPRLHALIGKYIIPTEGDFDCGFVNTKYTPLLITPGLGEVILPLRWFNPPTIDIVRI